MSVKLTSAQARTVAELAEREGGVSLHQLADDSESSHRDVYATGLGATSGYRIAPDGSLSRIGETLPAGL
jgi:hypothetical protein